MVSNQCFRNPEISIEHRWKPTRISNFPENKLPPPSFILKTQVWKMYIYKLNIESLLWREQSIQSILNGFPSIVFKSEGRIHPSVWEDIGVAYIFDEENHQYEFLRISENQEHFLNGFPIIPNHSIPVLSPEAVLDLNNIATNKEFHRLFPKYFFYEIFVVLGAISPSKMYILIKDQYRDMKTGTTMTLPEGRAIVAASHASLSTWLRFANHPTPMVRCQIKSWVRNSFAKVVCKVSEEEFESSKMCALHNVITESSLGNAEVAIAFLPRHEYPDFFSGFHLYK